jgi:hypothetical protein
MRETCHRGHDWPSNVRQKGQWQECSECRREWVRGWRLQWGPTTAPWGTTKWLWEDNAAEYKFMRHELGMSIREIAAKVGLSKGSIERQLHRRVGPRTEW